MNEEFFNILAKSDIDIDSGKLMDYLQGKLSAEEKHQVEKAIADSEFLNDAIEGLEKIKEPGKLQTYVDQLNKELHNHLERKKLRREKRRLKENPWIYFAIIFILLLSIIAYIVIRQYLH
jgi:signal recognition particle GTPase